MIDEIRQLARHAFRPSTSVFGVGEYLGFSAMLDLEPSTPVLHVGSGKEYQPRTPSETELATILAALTADPPKPQQVTPLEALERFTESEQDAIEAHAPRLARRLFSAIEPISWTTFAASVAELQAGGLVDAEQAERILS